MDEQWDVRSENINGERGAVTEELVEWTQYGRPPLSTLLTRAVHLPPKRESAGLTCLP